MSLQDGRHGADRRRRPTRYLVAGLVVAGLVAILPVWGVAMFGTASPFVQGLAVAGLSIATFLAWSRSARDVQRQLDHVNEDRLALRTQLERLPLVVYRCAGPHRRDVELLNRGGLLLDVGEPGERPTSLPSFDVLVSPDDSSRIRREVELAVRAGCPYRIRYDARRPDGTTVHVEDWGLPILREGQSPLVVGMLVDASELRGLEHRINHTDRLELLGRMASEVAHDLGNLLAPARMTAHFLGELEFEPEVSEDIEVVNKALAASTSLVHQLMQFVRPTADGPLVVRLEDLVRDNQLLLSRIAGRSTQMRFDLDAPDGEIRAVPTEVQQLLFNLIVNAGEAVADGGEISVETRMVTLTTKSTEAGLPPGHYVRLVVQDNGRGMDERTRQRLFEPFFSTKGPQGTGLGMAIVHAVVRRNDGTIVVDSEPGRGTRVAVYFPSAEAEASSGVVA